jgi:hypothetical protein
MKLEQLIRTLNKLGKNVAYSSEGTSSTLMMYNQISSVIFSSVELEAMIAR